MVRLTSSGFKALSSICIVLGEVFFAALIGSLVLPVDRSELLIVTLYSSAALISWSLSVLFAEEGKL